MSLPPPIHVAPTLAPDMLSPCEGLDPHEPPPLSPSHRGEPGRAVGPPGHCAAAAPRLGQQWVKGGERRHPKHSHTVLSQNHTLEFVGACSSVPSPFGLFLLLLAFLWDLLPVLQDTEGNISTGDTRLGQISTSRALGTQQNGMLVCICTFACISSYMYSSATCYFSCHTASENCLHL